MAQDNNPPPRYWKIAIPFGALKEAMLYFEHVICLSDALEGFADRLSSAQEFNWDEFFEVRKHLDHGLLPPELRTPEFSILRYMYEEAVNAAISPRGRNGTKQIQQELHPIWVKLCTYYPGIAHCPLIENRLLLDNSLRRSTQKQPDEDILLKVASLKLIDTHACDWTQLLEFRKDTDSRNLLRRLRLFCYENYQGKSHAYIEDDLRTRVADYERAVKKWGFTTATGAINAVLDSKLIAGGIAGSFLSAYYQEPLLAIASGIGAAGISLAKIGIELGKQKHERGEIMATNPVSYISYAKEKLNSK